MDVKFINPFVESVYDTFSTMLKAAAERGELTVSDSTSNPRSLVGLIGMTGPIRGTVALNLPINTAMAVVNRLLGTDLRIVDDTVSDAVAELVNIIAGGAKARLPQGEGPPIDLSIPTVVKGNTYRIDYPTDAVWLELSFTSELGPFTLSVTMEKS